LGDAKEFVGRLRILPAIAPLRPSPLATTFGAGGPKKMRPCARSRGASSRIFKFEPSEAESAREALDLCSMPDPILLDSHIPTRGAGRIPEHLVAPSAVA